MKIVNIPLLAFLLLSLFMTEGEARSLRIAYLTKGNDSPADFYLYGVSYSAEIDLNRSNFSKEITIPDGNVQMALLKHLPEEGSPPPQGAPVITVSESWERVLVVLLHDPDNSVFPVKPLVINASRHKLAKGQSRIYNLTDYIFAGSLGDVKIKLESGKSTIVKAPRKDTGDYTTILGYENKEGEIIKFFSGVWRHYPEHRQLIFIVPPNKGRHPVAKTFRDFESQKEEE